MNHISFLAVGAVSLALSSCPPAPPGTSVEVIHLNGTGINDPVSDVAGGTKVFRIQVIPHGNTVPEGEVGADYSLNQPTPIALNNASRAVAVRISGTPTTESVFDVFIPGSANLRRCEWFHYRWSFRYQLPGETAFRGFYGEQTHTFQMRHNPPGVPDPATPCSPVP